MGLETIDREEKIQKACELFRHGLSVRKVAEKLSVSWETANRFKKIYEERQPFEVSETFIKEINLLHDLNQLQNEIFKNIKQDLEDNNV